ncbi:MAG: 2-hydroxyacid dehydrogenase [Lachnospiraceae bacterium]|nr:2-hydroxyacid dehydrogenase [Lachnospiraceae bacterium]
MKILFYDTKNYDSSSFDAILPNFADKSADGKPITIEYIKSDLDPRTAALAEGFDAVCAFVSSDVGADTLQILHDKKVGLVLMRCAGFNNVDIEKATELGIRVMRVPGYSPEAVAEHAMALALACNRRLYKAYNKVRENDFSLSGLMGVNFYQKTAGIISTGKIGAAMCRICHGFGMRVIAYDIYPNESLKEFVEYVSLEELLAQSDLISIHCPLMDSTYHMINIDTIKQMKDGVVLVNTSRGALIKTDDLVEGIRMHKFGGVGLDVYEEETNNVFEDRSDEILEHSTTSRLLSFPNVMITSHQGFFTQEALEAIAETSLQNALDYQTGKESPNDVM